ncbi:phosphoprotein associated with glycosphingolipid-enriched microdomains 1 [Hoplias malabaricus]|uniref:phosphoprotein associated with glycosphingolipid-enriched microdomains 1 n=1 Tax=Hoplias malabaricus TaxID=27720 RepID=UPI003462597B
MAPALSALWGSGVAGSEVGGTAALANGELALVGTLTAFSVFLILTLLLLLLCASCQGQKKASQLPGDHENLMNGVSEKETCSQSADTGSHGTDLVASSSHNGPLTSGTVLTDTMDTSPHPSEEMLSSQSELRSSKCPQDRELPSIPPNGALQDGSGAPSDGTYEVLKDGAPRDLSAEDSLYETVKELKDVGLRNGTVSPDEPPVALLNGRLSPSPGTPDRSSLPNGVEYASVDLNKKSRYSADIEARRSAINMTPAEPEEDEKPPPIPDKALDENDNQQINGLQNEQLHPAMSCNLEPQNGVSPAEKLLTVYSTVVKPVEEEEKENDYSCIGEIKGLMPESASSDLYATVRDVYPSPPSENPQEEPMENTDPGYETIKIPKIVEEGQQGNGHPEPDYESVGELDLTREISRL